jgi:hypothetical protein
MKIPSSKSFVLIGFAISLASVVLNTFVLASINSQLKSADSEYYELNEALTRQVSQLNEADIKFDLYRIMHNMAFSSPPAKAPDARDDAKAILQSSLVKFYAAANDISPIDVTRAAVDEAEDVIPRMEKVLGLMLALQQSTDPLERARLTSEIEKLSREESPPKTELAKKLREIGKYADAELVATNEIELMAQLFPVMKSLREQIVGSIQRKKSRMQELEQQRSALGRKANYASYAAISLQLFGLMFILAKDIVKDVIRDR